MQYSDEMPTRYIKVYDQYIHRLANPDYFVPRIHLCGKWLENAGFKIGDQIKVIVYPQFLIIVHNNSSGEDHTISPNP